MLHVLGLGLSPGARLQLSSVTITTTPSCVSLALHQDLAWEERAEQSRGVCQSDAGSSLYGLLMPTYTGACREAYDKRGAFRGGLQAQGKCRWLSAMASIIVIMHHKLRLSSGTVQPLTPHSPGSCKTGAL